MTWTLECFRDYPSFRLAAQLEAPVGRVALIGSNGAGKSTLLRTLLDELPDTRSRVFRAGEPLLWAEGGGLVPAHQRSLAYLPQRVCLFNNLSALDNAAFGLARRSGWRGAREEAERCLERIGLADLRHARVHTLSAGQRQAVGLIRALISGARALILDEPMAALDGDLAARLRAFILTHIERSTTHMLLGTHDASLVREVAEWVVVLDQGKIIESGPVERLIAHAQSTFAKRFFQEKDGQHGVRGTS